MQGGSPQPAFIGQLNYADPNGKFTFITTDGEGKDKPSGGTATSSFLSDNDFTYNFSSTVLAGLDYTYLYRTPTADPQHDHQRLRCLLPPAVHAQTGLRPARLRL